MLKDFKSRVNSHSYASDSKASLSVNREFLTATSPISSSPVYYQKRLSTPHPISGLPPKGKGSSGANVRSSTSSQSTLSGTSTSPPSTPVQHRLSSSQSLASISSDLLLDHSHLKPGANAALLSYDRTINMYRENAKKTNVAEIQYDFAMFLVEAAKRLEGTLGTPAAAAAMTSSVMATGTTTTSMAMAASTTVDESVSQQSVMDDDNASVMTTQTAAIATTEARMRRAYLLEAEKLLRQTALRGHSKSQYYLARMYAAGLLSKRGDPEFDKAFPLFVQAAKHHDPDAAFRTAKCYEDGLGTKRDRSKSIQFYKKSAALNHPGAMYRLGLAEMNGELGITRDLRDGHKWLKRSAEAATPQYPHALHELGLLHEKGFNSIIFIDHTYAVRLYSDSAALGYAPSAFRLGECYEFGRLGCKPDASLSIKYYSIAADQGHLEACFALSAWYLIGTPELEPSEEHAFSWAYQAAMRGLPKAEFAIGYFYEVGIGVPKDIQIAIRWYNRAAANGDKRAAARLHQAPASYRSTTAYLGHTSPQKNKKTATTKKQQQQPRRLVTSIGSRFSLLKSKNHHAPASPVVDVNTFPGKDAPPTNALDKDPTPLANFV